MKSILFVAATLLATAILVAAGLGEGGQGPRTGGLDVSQR
jgi:hypothetical protein